MSLALRWSNYSSIWTFAVNQEVRRKLTTILAADIKDYSRLMDADEEGTLGLLRDRRNTLAAHIDRHRGRIVSTAGDGLLAEFPSVVEAMQCAVEVQKELAVRNAADARRMEYRIGINIGDVMEEDDDLYGEGVNVAARLQELSQAGGICISSSVFEQVHNKLSVGFESIGEQHVKNISQPVSVYRIDLEPVVESAPSQTEVHDQDRRSPKGDFTESISPEDMAELKADIMKFGLVAIILMVIDLLTGGGLWFQWPLLVLAAAVGFRVIRAYRGRPLKSHGWKFGEIKEDTTFDEDTNYFGSIVGNLTVAESVSVRMTGSVSGDLTIEPNADVWMLGEVRGRVRNRGGKFKLIGKQAATE